MSKIITELFKTKRSIFTRHELAMIWKETLSSRLGSKITYYSKHGVLKKITRGLYAIKDKYDKRELAASIYMPSYISFETVLRDAGIIFQHYEAIFVASIRSKEITLDGNSLVFRKIKNEVLNSPVGIINNGIYSIATKERAFLDMIYIFPKIYLDNLGPIDWEKACEIVKIYNNKALESRLKIYRDHHNAQ